MAVKILKREYSNQFKPSSTTNFFLGNVGDWQKLKLECQFAVERSFNLTETLTIENPNILTLNTGETWQDLGFAVGMSCFLDFYYKDITQNPAPSFFNRVSFIIQSISGDTLEASSLIDVAGNNVPITQWGYQYGQIAPIRFADYEIERVLVFSDQLPQGIEIEYSHMSNQQIPSGNLNSFVDGTRTRFRAEDTDKIAVGEKYEIGQVNDFDYNLSFQSGMSVIKATCEFLAGQTHKKIYLIEIIYMVSCFGELQDFVDGVAPSYVRGTQAIGDNFLVTGFPVYNNPNVTIKNDTRDTADLGNTGWYDENFNQLPNNFTLPNPKVQYRNLNGDVLTALDYANPTTIRTKISGIPNLTGSTRFQYGFVWLPLDEDYYKSNDFPLYQNLKTSTGGRADTLDDWFTFGNFSPFPNLRNGYTITGAPQPVTAGTTQADKLFAANDAKLDASDISFVQNGSDVDVTITFRPNAAFASFIDSIGENERRYALWISVGDSVPDYNLSDRVSLLLDFNQMVTFVQPVGQYPGMEISFTDHPQNSTSTPIACGNSIFVEDDLLARVSFREDTAVAAGIPDLQSITFGFLMNNATTGVQYKLDSNSVDLTQFPDPTQYNFDQSRGFKLGAGNDKNWFKVDYDAPNDSGTQKGVLGWYGFKIRWEDWIKRFPVPPNDFYDNTQNQNGLNNDWYHYFNTAGWTFNFYVEIGAILDGSNVVYQNLVELTIKDYNSNSNITTELKYYRDNNGVKGVQLTGGIDPISGLPLGVIENGEYVWLDIEYTWTGAGSPADWADQATVDANVYGVNCIEVDQGAGQFSFRQLSSVHLPEFDNPMEPLPNGTLANVLFDSPTKLIVESRINANKLISATRYKVSGRLGCK